MVFFYLSPSKYSTLFLKSNIWGKIKINLSNKQKINFKNKIIYYVKKLENKSILSSCLSRSTLLMIILETFGIKTNLFLGMSLDNRDKKVPHAWLEIKKNGEIITSKIENCVIITKI